MVTPQLSEPPTCDDLLNSHMTSLSRLGTSLSLDIKLNLYNDVAMQWQHGLATHSVRSESNHLIFLDSRNQEQK